MLSLYVHIPFCVGKCRYCGFYSTSYTSQGVDDFIGGLQREALHDRSDFSGRKFNTLYIGGGTPTILTTEQFARIVGIIRGHFAIVDDAEFTIEANPNTVTRDILSQLIRNGVNRISLGVQSLSDALLHVLGRRHNAEQALHAFALARDVGFRNIGIDLIYGIPGQTMAQWEETLDSAAALRPEHVSVYSLSVDEGSAFHHQAAAGGFSLPDDDIVARMYELAVLKLGIAGYQRYEISNFALPGFACEHNMNYWDRGEYLGLGPAAWSFLSGRRRSNIADAAEYARRLSVGSSIIDADEVVGPESAARESILLGLRTMKGLDLSRFEREYGRDILNRLERNAVPLRDTGLLLEQDGFLRLSDRGILLLNDAIARLAV